MNKGLSETEIKKLTFISKRSVRIWGIGGGVGIGVGFWLLAVGLVSR